MNQIFAIKPYLWNGVWVFDDPRVGLVKEALIAGMPEIIVAATQQAGIASPERGFVALFSPDPFPDALEFAWVREESGGNVYRWQGMEGWLCPALFKYFASTPPRIYVQARPLDRAWTSFDEWYLAKQPEIAALFERIPDTLGLGFQKQAGEWLQQFARDAWNAGAGVGQGT